MVHNFGNPQVLFNRADRVYYVRHWTPSFTVKNACPDAGAFVYHKKGIVEYFFFNDTATTEFYTNLNTLSLHDALPICSEEHTLNSSNFKNLNTPSSACARPS